jgi:hypothetical protein
MGGVSGDLHLQSRAAFGQDDLGAIGREAVAQRLEPDRAMAPGRLVEEELDGRTFHAADVAR